jgi:AcrR family transcriptional regulator
MTEPAKASTRGERTRARILELAEAAVILKGYAATSIDELIAGAGITKSGFFYHFREKGDLARALLERDIADTVRALQNVFAEAEAIHQDPLEATLDGLGRFADLLSSDTGAMPGCLVASFTYQEALLDPDQRALLRDAVMARRRAMRARLDQIAARYTPRGDIDLDDLAGMAVAIVQGGFIIDRVRTERIQVVKQQIELYRAFLREIFTAA